MVPAEELLSDGERTNYAHAVEAALHGYRESLPHDRQALFDLYRFRGMARKVVGVGSVGTRAWVLHFAGPAVKAGPSLGDGALRGPQSLPPCRQARR
jgi:hypothetical protein